MNDLTKENEKMIVEYTPLGGEPMKLSPSMVMKYFVGSNSKVTVGEVAMFIALCKEQKLNPFLKEAYLIKYGEAPAQIVTGKEAFMKRAKASPDYVTHKAGVIVDHDGEIQYMPGAFKRKADELLGAWAEIITRSNPEYPVRIEVSFEEYNTGKSNWASKKCTMIRKVALVQALREAFPNHLGAMYTADEIQVDNEPIKDITPDVAKLEANTEVLDMPEADPVETTYKVVDDETADDSETADVEQWNPTDEELAEIHAKELKESEQVEMPEWA